MTIQNAMLVLCSYRLSVISCGKILACNTVGLKLENGQHGKNVMRIYDSCVPVRDNVFMH